MGIELLGDPSQAFRLVDELGSDMISIHSRDGAYLFVSTACERILGWSAKQLLGTSAHELLHPEDPKPFGTDQASLAQMTAAPRRFRHRMRCKSRDFRWVESTCRYHVVGDVAQFICFTRDAQLEEEARSSRRAAALVLAEQERVAVASGILAALNHELNNPLMAASLALEAVAGRDGDEDSLEQAKKALKRMHQVIRELSLSVRGSWEERTELDVSKVTEQVLSLLPQSGHYRVQIKLRSVIVSASETLLLQCLYHIAYAHLLGLPADGDELSLSVATSSTGGEAMVAIESNVVTPSSRMRADVGALLRGEGERVDGSLQLAERLALELNGALKVQPTAHGLATYLTLPELTRRA